MDRNREARRASIVGSNGFNRRRHRTNSLTLRDSPDEDGGPELQESVRLRDRLKKDRDRDRDLRERSSRSKRRRAEIAGDDTSEESVNDEEDDDEDEEIAAVRFSSPAAASTSNHHGGGHSSSFSQQQHHHHNNSNSNANNIVSSNNNHHLQHRKTFPPSSSSSTARVVRAPPPVWKPGDEMISVAVPRKARSVSSKRSHDWISSSNNSGNGDQNPAQQSVAAPNSPASSMKMNLKHGPSNNPGSKLKPPKATSLSAKPSSSNAEELEIEIAEVLYGLMTQSQEPTSSKKDEISKFNGAGKSLNSNSSPLSAVAPKRKKPRQVPEGPNFGLRSSPMAKPEPETPTTDQTPKSEVSSPPKSERISGSAAEHGGGAEIGGISVISDAQPPVPESRVTAEEMREARDLIMDVKEGLGSPKEQEYPAVRDRDRHFRGSPLIAIASSAPTTINAPTPINANTIVSEVENQKEVKFKIDLMAPPPERETKFDTTPISVDQKPVLSTLDASLPVVVSKDSEAEKGRSGSGNNSHSSNVATAERKVTEGEPNKAVELKDNRNLDLRLDLEKPERDISSSFSAKENKSQLPAQKHQQPVKLSKEEQSRTEKPGHSRSSLSLNMPVASWPGGLPPMGFMAPLQGVVDGGGVTPLQPLFSQPRPKRCATHCHIARNIHCLQQFIKMNPFWPAPGGTPPVAASLFGSKPCSIPSAVPSASDFNAVMKGLNNNGQDRKGQQNSAGIPNNVGKEKGSPPASSSDSAKKKQQILIQQPMPPVAPSNLMGPGFIFPISQQQVAVAAAATRPSSGAKSPTTVAPCNAVSTFAGPSSTSSPAPMSFNYPNMPPNETQYLAILQNNAYPFPIPTVGPPPNYRGGPPAQTMSLFNGPFYSSQIIHQPLQHSQHQPSNQTPQMMQVQHTTSAGQMMLAHHNANAGNNSSSSQKHIQSQQQQRPQNSFSSQKAQSQPHNNQYMHGGGIDDNSPSSAADNRGSRATSVNIYGQNFALPIHSQSFALLTPNALPVTNSSNQAEKKSSCQSQQQQQGMKTEVESLAPHTFAMSFGPGIDAASMAQSHAMFQNCSEGARQNIQMMAVATASQVVQKNSNFRISEEAKSGNSTNLDNSSVREDERKSFAFADAHTASSTQANNNAGPACHSRPAMSNGSGAMNSVQNAQFQAQFQQPPQQQMLQLKHHQQQQQMAVNAINRTNKPPGTSNGSIYSEHLNSSLMMGGKFPNAISPVFPQNLVQRSNSPTPSPSQSPQWKSSSRASVSSSQAGPSSLGSSIHTMHKNPPQQHSRNQPPMHAQISFGGNKKQPATPLQGQGPPPSGNQGPSSPMMVGSPTTSSLSKGTSGSPRTNSSASTSNNKTGGLHVSPFTAQPPKNSPSILGNPKPQMQQQQSQQKNMQQPQLFFSNPYSQSPHLSSGGPGATSTSGYYVPQRRPDQHQRAPHGASTNDPATAIAAATSNAKGGGLQSGGMMVQASPLTLLPAGYSYVHPVPAGVQMKPAEQKQPAGNDNSHQWQPEKK